MPAQNNLHLRIFQLLYIEFFHLHICLQNFLRFSGVAQQFQFNEAVSFVVDCETQEEIDYYWEKLTANGGSEGQCGWLKDQFGVSWQIVPTILPKLLSDPAKAQKVLQAYMQMKKFDIEKLENA